MNIESLFNSSSKVFKLIENPFIPIFVNHLHQQTEQSFKNLRLFIIGGENLFILEGTKSCLFSDEEDLMYSRGKKEIYLFLKEKSIYSRMKKINLFSKDICQEEHIEKG